ncbi:MAG TPA: hypothetical protein VD902_06645 [Symbiobacteriaceae bacterium]|nr:hypothetical protein [Symbiobacteriaceae bacterium]
MKANAPVTYEKKTVNTRCCTRDFFLAGLTIESGYKERFDVAYVPQGSPLWPGLVIDLSQPWDRRVDAKKKGPNA